MIHANPFSSGKIEKLDFWDSEIPQNFNNE